MREVTEADREAVRHLIGCQWAQEECEWVGVVYVEHVQGRKFRVCRGHSATFRDNPEWAVVDSGYNNRRIPALSFWAKGERISLPSPFTEGLQGWTDRRLAEELSLGDLP